MTDLNTLPFTHAVWFMENGDTDWRICAVTMDENDALAIVRANDPKSGALKVLPFGTAPTCRHCDNPPMAGYGNCLSCAEEVGGDF